MYIIPNVFSKEQIEYANQSIDECSEIEEQSAYGRYMFHELNWDYSFQSTVLHQAEEAVGEKLIWTGAGCAEYTAKAGEPNLPPHFDGDTTDYIMTYQLSSNKDWPLGVDYNVVTLEDNSGVIFEPNKNIHWRTHAKFEDGEFVRMMFFRFQKPMMSDYSDMALSISDPIFDDINEFRDSIVATILN